MRKARKLKLSYKIFIGLFLGIIVGAILSAIGKDTPFVETVVPWLGLLGDLFLRLIRMVVVPLVLFSITSGVANLNEIKKLRSVGIKTLIFFLLTGFLSIGTGVVMANIFKPGAGLNIAELSADAIEIQELPTVFETILGLFPANIFESLVEGEMLHIISFAIFVGAALLLMGERGKPIVDLVDRLSDMMYRVVDIVIQFTPIGVFGLMAKAVTAFGVGIFGPVFKFILVDYGANIFTIAVFYSLIIYFIGRVNPIKFFKKAFESWAIAFSTCSSAAALPVAMKNGVNEMGIPKDTASFVLPLGATANMNGTGIYFGVIVLFAAQLYGIDISISQQIMLVLTATMLSIGCAAAPQTGLIISIALLTNLGIPLDGIALIAGVYRIVDQIHTSTNSMGDLVVAVAVSSMEGDLDRELLEYGGMFATSEAK
ncbi:dicarboxylate/amino acid:cation symporter [Tepidimicrobium xylanilyticum]|uniref:Na+/H+-dicarboxylate symporter n=1 Tax=Tepidimicrobium xylanilyticum TaxID=1123352 RepID=A0A1H2XSK3_9FIRM|nr:dicarboxylate/amino acid:cation symporter [Tepidimicrobium xylanilyticum]GMG97576.1 dicarboxylate:amino acid:cation symporter DAACS family protein [Tepidimicrobium xylanilyticum]SDW95765.1 Na+/H+-dicarboxylate symporter [Tepidimicrobium xylanilyticum]